MTSQSDLYAEIAQLRERIEELEAELTFRNEQRVVSVEALARSELNIPKWLAPILCMFMTREFVRHTAIDAIGDEKERSDFSTFHSLAVHHLRKRLQGTGVEITTVWGQGYSINAASRERLNELVYGRQH